MISLYDVYSRPTELDGYDKHNLHLLVPKYAYDYARKNYKWWDDETKEKVINVLLKSQKFTFYYAKNILCTEFPQGEPIIATSSGYSVCYAADVIKRRFPLGEPIIATSAEDSYFYAVEIIGGRFKMGEPAILKDPKFSKKYEHILYGDHDINDESI